MDQDNSIELTLASTDRTETKKQINSNQYNSNSTGNNQDQKSIFKNKLTLSLIGLIIALVIALVVMSILYALSQNSDGLKCKIDTHSHAWEGDWYTGTEETRRYTPPHGNDIDRYMAQLWAHKFEYGVLVQPSYMGTNNTYIEEQLIKYENLRGVAVVDPVTITTSMLNQMDKVGFRGIRLNLKGYDMDEWYQNAHQYDAVFKWIKENDWHVEAQQTTTNWVKLIEFLLNTGCKIVVDHFGRPDQQLGVNDPGFKAILKAGKENSRVWIKCSAMYRIGGGTPEGDKLIKQYADLVLDNFGIKRILWGSDYPYVSSDDNFQDSQDMGELFSAFQDWFPKTGQQQQVQKNAIEFFRFENAEC